MTRISLTYHKPGRYIGTPPEPSKRYYVNDKGAVTVRELRGFLDTLPEDTIIDSINADDEEPAVTSMLPQVTLDMDASRRTGNITLENKTGHISFPLTDDATIGWSRNDGDDAGWHCYFQAEPQNITITFPFDAVTAGFTPVTIH